MEADTQELTKLPIKRTDENDIFKLPHPSAAPFMKRRKQHEKKYDEELLLKKFGFTALKNIIVNDNYIRSGSSRMSGFTWQFLKKNFVLPLNNAQPLGCFVTNNGSLAIFSPPLEDIQALNNLLPFIMEKLNVNASAHVKVEFDTDKPLFIRDDSLSLFWNKDGQKISLLPRVAFQGKVALKVMGLMYYEGVDGSGCTRVKLSVHLEQVKVMDEGNHEDELMKDCMFN